MRQEMARHTRLNASDRLLQAIAEAQAFYDQRYRELVGSEEVWRDADDEAASWLTVLRGPNAAR